MKAAYHTLGCKVNAYETEAVRELLEARGYAEAKPGEIADVVVLNTCTVTNTGDAKSRKQIRHAVDAHPGAVVVVMGCFTQLKGAEALNIDGVSVVLGTNNRHQIPELVERFQATRQPIDAVIAHERKEPFEALEIKTFEHHRRAFLKIQDGCDNFCTFCIIPYARGRVRSRDPYAVIKEAEALVSAGHLEIVLTGIHTGGFGSDLEDYTFSALLTDLATIPSLKRIRISSIEINELTDDVLDVFQTSKAFCEHLHIPLQSGSDGVLKRMNRKYDTAFFRQRIAAIRSRFPDWAISTDVIVGFPGETEEEFLATCAFVEELSFSQLHVFPYSKRTGTVAAQWPDLDGSLKKHRVQTLIAIGEDLSNRYVSRFLGSTLDVVPETWKDGILDGHASNYIRIRFPGDESRIGTMTSVILKEATYPIAKGLRNT
jgi:threonylcarbamoyladenosine tRNA methylthiotransferase MtaB